LPPPAPSAAPKGESQSSSYDSQDPLQKQPVEPPRKAAKLEPKWAPPTPKWKSLEFDIEAWDATLTELKVDDTAQQELYLLAQYSNRGAQMANHVLSKVLKKIADGDQVRNWSAFVHSCVKSARHELDASWYELE
jgi:hypothetical protein